MAAADGQFSRIRQIAPMCRPMRAHCCHLANTIELVLPSAHPSSQRKRQIDRFSHFLHSSQQSAIHFLANVNSRSLLCYRPSVYVCRLSSVTFVRCTQAVQIFGNISTALGTMAID